MWHGAAADLKLAARRLAATPLFTLFAVFSLAIGLGATTAAYSLVASLFFTSSGVPDQDRLVSVMTAWDGRLVNGGLSTVDVEELQGSAKSLAAVTAYALIYPAVTTPRGTDLLRTEAVDGAYFDALRVQAAIGRPVDRADVTGARAVAVISHALWTRRFAADPNLVGQTLRVGGQWFEVIGVAPKDFRGFGGPFRGTHLWIPTTSVPRDVATGFAWNDRERPRFMVVGRLAPKVKSGVASTELALVGSRLDAAQPRSNTFPGPQKRDWHARPVSGEGDVIMRRSGIVMVALVALVLVVACTNLANLVLARGTARQHELAVRRAIGASRWRLVREQCTESVLIAILGAGAAWLIFNALSTALDVDLPIAGQLLITFRPVLDPAALVIALGALGLSLVVFGLEPAFQLTRERALRDGLAVSSGNVGVPKAKRQRSLVRWQVAISTGFFILAALSVKYTVAEARHDSGVDLDRLAVATMNFWRQQWDGERPRLAVRRVLEELEKDAAVESAAVSTGVPFGSTGTAIYFMATPEKPIVSEGTFRWGPGIAGTPRIFQTLGIRTLRGRTFDDRDDASAAPVAVISERTALNLFGTADAVGRPMIIKPRAAAPEKRSVARRLALPSTATPAQTSDATRTVRIVGVVSDTDVLQLFGDQGDIVYLPLAQEPAAMPFAIALARTHDDPSAGVRALRNAISRANPDLAIESLGTGLGTLGGPTVILRAATGFALVLGGLTLVLAMVGLFGVQSHGVAHRTREIGVRMSFGATAVQIRGLVLKDGYRPVVQGILLGIFIGLVGRGLARAFLWEKIELVDAWMVFAVPIPMILAAFLACWWPAQRASRVDPNVALRHL